MNFESLQVGQRLHQIDKGVITTAHIMRWSAAVENFHRIHYDAPFAIQHDGLPGVLINGSWKQHVLVQLVKDALAPSGWLWRLKFRYRKMDVAGDALRAIADMVEKREAGGFGFVTLKIALIDQLDRVSTEGHAIGVLPLAGGPPVPYPFRADPAWSTQIGFPQDA
ncbi:MAG: MaoC family dehydratase [Betaproteobacteria bacterium]